MEVSIRCKNLGCNQNYMPSENHDRACRYHKGPVIFQDTKKGYSCCNQISYDWDEFNLLVGCQVGLHSDVKPTNVFQSSSTVENAQRAIRRDPGVQIKSIDDLEREIQEREKKAAELRALAPPQPVLNKDGLFVCSNFGCNKPFRDEDNVEGCCRHHKSGPGFHDLKKFWSCCNQTAWDWDDFMKFEPCSIGMHVKKMKK